ncbi:hypothetical protein [Nocardia sp. NPDC024068]|uniref:hypothetical protein n=1 Tax=Nocardia sp. NPDC024068 TaxID=3157197 RepID=UPI00340FAD3A
MCFTGYGLFAPAVADALGVDRAAVSHHVSGRDALLSMGRDEDLRGELLARRDRRPAVQDACRAYTHAFTNSPT